MSKNNTNFTIENGDEVKSETTGFKGIVIARAEHIHGCNRYNVQPPMKASGEMGDGYWFDEDDLTITKAKKVKVEDKKPRGGFHRTDK